MEKGTNTIIIYANKILLAFFYKEISYTNIVCHHKCQLYISSFKLQCSLRYCIHSGLCKILKTLSGDSIESNNLDCNQHSCINSSKYGFVRDDILRISLPSEDK